MAFTTEGLFEVAIESWPEWDLNPRLLQASRVSLKKKTPAQVFSYKFCKVLKDTLFAEHLQTNFSIN